ncbi:MAG: acyl-CoA dehydratase activase [Deltaproteobacteria bacterium]|jgi:predicted CoA-substrate-specific enzyme activase|nr:acyl-CoA dehydratase activase [Deltaproteobacteria bacterium]
MTFTAGLDVGSAYTKALILNRDGEPVARAMVKTGFRMAEAAERAYRSALEQAGLAQGDIGYLVSTGYGRLQVALRDTQVTELTAQAHGVRRLFPRTATVLDVGGQTMKALKLDPRGRVVSFRLNEKCAAGTGAFLEKTARYLGFELAVISQLVDEASEPVPISSVCAVFAESEVINHVSAGCAPGDIVLGAVVSLAERAVQLMKRVRAEPEFTLVGGILRFKAMGRVVGQLLKAPVNVPEGEMAQFCGALGAATLARRRLAKLGGRREAAPPDRQPLVSAAV